MIGASRLAFFFWMLLCAGCHTQEPQSDDSCCIIRDDPIVTTGDNQTIALVGDGWHQLFKNPGFETVGSTIEGKFTHVVVVLPNGDIFVFTPDGVILPDGTFIESGGPDAELWNEDGVTLNTKDGYYVLEIEGFGTIKICFMSDGNVSIEICVNVAWEPFYGICQNFDGDASNDLRLADGTDVSGRADRYKLISDSFVVDSPLP